MAGAGFKTFNTGDVLTASDVNTYLMQQTVMVFDDAAARTSALGANVAEGMFSYLKDTNLTYRYDGSSWLSDAGTTSPLTTKGDIWVYGTSDTRLPVGTNGYTLVADSAETTGLKYSAGNPSFSATKTGGNQTLSNATWTKITFQTEEWDTDNCFDNSTNYRFTPSVAGKYLISTNMRINAGSAGNLWFGVYKNGSLFRYLGGSTTEETNNWYTGSTTMSFNGTTDYVEIYVYGADAPNIVSGGDVTVFQGSFVRL